jgi:hypothetical protein
VFHVEIRQFPHNYTQFNLEDRELWAIIEPWVREQVIERGERKWSPHQATLTVLEGPQLPLDALSLGRGWRTAERESSDVTERVLARAREVIAASPAAPSAQSAGQTAPLPGAGPDAARAGGPQTAAARQEPPADPLVLGVQLASLLGSDPERLLGAWREIAARAPSLAPSESLALAERRIAEPRDDH